MINVSPLRSADPVKDTPHQPGTLQIFFMASAAFALTVKLLLKLSCFIFICFLQSYDGCQAINCKNRN